ncbi:MAG TPA: ABC transporter transmembrane domain-containing protein [Candidatus Nanopelagicaceae bacterium]
MKSVDLRLLLSSRGGRRLFSASLIAGAFWSLLVVVNAYLIAEIIVGITGHRSHVFKLVAALGFLWLVRSIFQARFDYWCSLQAIRIKRQLRAETTSHIENFAGGSSARLSTILTKGLNSLDIYLGRFIPQMIFATITPLVVIVVMFFQDSISGAIAIITLPLIPLFGALIGRYSSESVMRKWQTLGTLSAYFEDSLRGFVTLKIFGRSRSQSKRIGEMGDVYTDETMKVLRISFLSAFALELIATLSVAVIAVSIGLRLLDGAVPFKTALIVLVLAPEVYFPVRNAASLFHASQDGTQALRELESVRIDTEEVAPIAPLEFKEVSSITWERWECSDGAVVPVGEVGRGQMLFILGESGIGKTTFADNLLALTFSASVAVRDGAKVFELTDGMQNAWQRKVGWIPQNPQLATGSVRDQFRLVDPTVGDEQIMQYLAMSGLSIDDLPDGLDTHLGKGGESSHAASGGQIRRIAVARALFRQPAIVVADEPTADLDRQSADAVMHALRQAQADGAIVVCITHDPTLIGPADLVCEVDRNAL